MSVVEYFSFMKKCKRQRDTEKDNDDSCGEDDEEEKYKVIFPMHFCNN